MRSALALWLLAASASAQELSIRGPEPTVVRIGETALVTVSVDGASGDLALGPLPKLDGLEISASQPETRSRQAIKDGSVTERSSTSWQIALVPWREGAFDVPSIGVEIGDRTLTSQPLRLEAVRELTGAEHAFIELATSRDGYYLEEPIRLTLRFGFDRVFLNDHLLQLFGRRLDVPAQVQARWLDDLPGAVLLVDAIGDAPARAGGADERPRQSFALNDGLADATPAADRVQDGRKFAVLEIERTLLPTRSGELTIPGPLLRFAYTSRFDEDFMNGRVAADRHSGFVRGAPLVLTIRPLPEEGRPHEFSGAVGRFSVTSGADPRDVEMGQSLKLVLRFEGNGNLGRFVPPSLEDLEGFHVYGRIEDRRPTVRTVTYDLAPLRGDVKEIPAIRFAFFDPRSPEGYLTVETRPVPLEVRALAAGATSVRLPAGEGRGIVPGVNDIFDLKPVAAAASAMAPRRLSDALLLGVILSPWILALGLLALLRARERLRSDPEGARARGAAAAFHSRAGQAGVDLSEALAEFLAARLRCPAAAVIAPTLEARLLAAGVPRDLASRSAVLLEGLVAERYGGGSSSASVESARSIVDALEASFQSAERAR